jgi:ankyrin repeat protein
MKEYTANCGILASGTIADLEAFAERDYTFPLEMNEVDGHPWIQTAVSIGSKTAVGWILSKGVDLRVYTVFDTSLAHIALERTDGDKHAILRLLLEKDAPTNSRGLNNWTPLHLAAARNDVEGCRILVEFGADFTARTDIDDNATPQEEAASLGAHDAVAYLASLERK